MRFSRPFESGAFRAAAVILVVVASTLCGYQDAHAELHWNKAKKEPIKVRLVALTWNHQRSSFFASEEIFVAEKELDRDEGRLVKLIYGFLPYQPRLSESGLDYASVYEVRAMRDESCDESLSQMTAGDNGDWRQPASDLKYSADAPELNIQREKTALPCYRTSPEDYNKVVQRPLKEEKEKEWMPVLSVR